MGSDYLILIFAYFLLLFHIYIFLGASSGACWLFVIKLKTIMKVFNHVVRSPKDRVSRDSAKIKHTKHNSLHWSRSVFCRVLASSTFSLTRSRDGGGGVRVLRLTNS